MLRGCACCTRYLFRLEWSPPTSDGGDNVSGAGASRWALKMIKLSRQRIGEFAIHSIDGLVLALVPAFFVMAIARSWVRDEDYWNSPGRLSYVLGLALRAERTFVAAVSITQKLSGFRMERSDLCPPWFCSFSDVQWKQSDVFQCPFAQLVPASRRTRLGLGAGLDDHRSRF